MQADQKPVIWTVVIATILILVLGGIGIGSLNSTIGNKLDIMNTNLENMDVDEQAIANAIVAGIVMPEYDTEKIDELWEGVYSADVEELEFDSLKESVYQFLDDNNYPEAAVTEFLKVENISAIDDFFDELEGSNESVREFDEKDDLFDFLVDEYEDESEGLIRVIFIREYENDREFNIINLGLDDEDDREVELSGVVRVKIFLDKDDDEEYVFDKVYINSVVTSDDGDLEAEVVYSL